MVSSPLVDPTSASTGRVVGALSGVAGVGVIGSANVDAAEEAGAGVVDEDEGGEDEAISFRTNVLANRIVFIWTRKRT